MNDSNYPGVLIVGAGGLASLTLERGNVSLLRIAMGQGVARDYSAWAETAQSIPNALPFLAWTRE
jgi:hypothetical protein